MLNDSYSSAKAGKTHACVLCMGLATTIGGTYSLVVLNIGARAHAYNGDTDRGMYADVDTYMLIHMYAVYMHAPMHAHAMRPNTQPHTYAHAVVGPSCADASGTFLHSTLACYARARVRVRVVVKVSVRVGARARADLRVRT